MIHGVLTKIYENPDLEITGDIHKRAIASLNLATRAHPLPDDDKRLYGHDATLTLQLFNDIFPNASIVAARQATMKHDGKTIPCWIMTVFEPPFKAEAIAPTFARTLMAIMLKIESYKNDYEKRKQNEH